MRADSSSACRYVSHDVMALIFMAKERGIDAVIIPVTRDGLQWSSCVLELMTDSALSSRFLAETVYPSVHLLNE